MSTGIEITLYDTHARVPNGMGSFKNITLQDFRKEIDRVCLGGEVELHPKQSFRLPNEARAVRYNVNELELVMYFPAAKREVGYGSQRYNAAFPAVVIFVTLKTNGRNGWTVENVRWAATDYTEDEIPNLDDWEIAPNSAHHLWVLPFPNQYGDFRMCIGANSYRSLYTQDLRGLNELFYHNLIAAPFNDDLWANGSSRITRPMNARTWFNQLNQAETFPYDMLPGYSGTPEASEQDEDDFEEEDDE